MKSERGFRSKPWILIGFLGALLIVSVLGNAALLSALGVLHAAKPQHEKPEDEMPQLAERWSYGDGTVKVVRINISGLILRDLEESVWRLRSDKVGRILREIRAATTDTEVKGLIVEVNSPGGDLTSCDEIYEALMEFKRAVPGRKIVAYTAGLAASGGYYVALPADHIVAQPTAVIGSIGVILQTLNWKGLSEKIGITDTTIKSGKHKDLLNPFHEVPEEQRQLVQQLIMVFHDHFVRKVCESRNLATEEIEPLADGRIFDVYQAQECHLIDSVGYWDHVMQVTAKLLGVPAVRVVRYESRPTLADLLASVIYPLPAFRYSTLARPQFLYLWHP